MPPSKLSSQITKSKAGHKKKKPDWDATVNDLSVYKASEDELAHRKAVAKSQNMPIVKDEKLQNRIRRARSGQRGRSQDRGLFKEYLDADGNLSTTLAKSDKVLSLVQDLFGDDPFKYQGAPNVTDAPKQSKKKSSSRYLPGSTELESTKLDQLSEALMDRLALNHDSSQDDEDLTEEDTSINYVPGLNMDRFRELLDRAAAEEEKLGLEPHRAYKQRLKTAERGTRSRSKERKRSEGSAKGEPAAARPSRTEYTQQHEGHTRSHSGQRNRQMPRPSSRQSVSRDHSPPPGYHTPERPCHNGAINDTVKVKKSRSKVRKGESEERKEEALRTDEQSTCDFDTLNQALGQVETEIADYESKLQNSFKKSDRTANPRAMPTLTGFTGRLVVAIHKMSVHIKECQSELRHEQQARQQLSEQVLGQQALINGLTQDVLALQEEHAGLSARFTQHSKVTCKLTQENLPHQQQNTGTSEPRFAPLEVERPTSIMSGSQVAGSSRRGTWQEPASMRPDTGLLPPSYPAPMLQDQNISYLQTLAAPGQHSAPLTLPTFPPMLQPTLQGNWIHPDPGHNMFQQIPYQPQHMQQSKGFATGHVQTNVAGIQLPSSSTSVAGSVNSNSIQPMQVPQHFLPYVLPGSHANLAAGDQAGLKHVGQAGQSSQDRVSHSLSNQIEDLNRRHLEAQNKLFMLMQNKSDTSLGNISHGAETSQPRSDGGHTQNSQVSPNISPIVAPMAAPPQYVGVDGSTDIHPGPQPSA